MQPAAAALVTALALGARGALGHDDERPPIVHQVHDDWPGPEQAIELHLDLPDGAPRDAWAVIRPWMLPLAP
ncbi:MAG TPA: hypothetical protein VHF47_13960 [Acidimicrobiales bacterium]|nr:hypothetical protein [Acidimicrobiales bacterium]